MKNSTRAAHAILAAIGVACSRTALFISTMAFVGALGCGGHENGTSSNASTGSSSGSGSSDASGGASAGDASILTERNPECPASVPTHGTSCKPPLECEYGDDSHHVCTTVAQCVSAGTGTTPFGWFVVPPPTDCGTNTASCPASFTALAAGSPCPRVTSFCEYPEGLCRCIPCGDAAGVSSMWGCSPWALGGMGCPPVRPLSGDACLPNQGCSYGGYCGVEVGPTMLCQDGYWRQAGQTGICIIPQCGVPEVDASEDAPDDAAQDAGSNMCPTQQPGLGARVACTGSLSCSYGQRACCGITSTDQTCTCQHGFFTCAQTVECNFICRTDAGHD